MDYLCGMRIIVLILLLGISIGLKAQVISERVDRIDSVLCTYGKQQSIANMVSIVSISVIGVCSIIGVPAEALIVVNMVADLTTIIITSKSNRKLSKHNRGK